MRDNDVIPRLAAVNPLASFDAQADPALAARIRAAVLTAPRARRARPPRRLVAAVVAAVTAAIVRAVT